MGVLEDSGYLARGAMIVDRPLALFGLSGRAFVPFMSGFACAIPAMMATRTISSLRERLATIFAIPLMVCSARLPVYGSFQYRADCLFYVRNAVYVHTRCIATRDWKLESPACSTDRVYPGRVRCFRRRCPGFTGDGNILTDRG